MDSQTAQQPLAPTTSREFPEGYGDFIFRSKDGVIFHFPLFLLAHVSPVFRDMSQIGENAPNQDVVTFAEDSMTLERLLCHIDPVKDTPYLDWDHMAGVLEAAEKYQIPSIIRWFEREVSLPLTATHYPTLPNPMLYYSLARRYNLHTTARLALRQLIRFPVSEVLASPHVDSSLIKDIFNQRVARTQWLVEVILECPNHPYASSGYAGCTYHANVSIYSSWKARALQAVVAEPSWSAIVFTIGKLHPSYQHLVCKCIGLENAKDLKEKTEKRG